MASHQTVRLAVGRHVTPAHGTCVMELASMLAGEPFTDRPVCVDPVLGAYLRDFNDRLGDVSRQRLKPYAALAVGTAGDKAQTRERRRRCLAFAARRAAPPRFARLRVLAAVGVLAAIRMDRGAAQWAVRSLDPRGVEPHGFRFLDALLGSVPDGAAPVAAAERPREVAEPLPAPAPPVPA